jgi:SAM-dependent methyltransferase
MSRLVAWMDDALYPGVGDNWDDDAFRRFVLEHVTPSTHLLDLGAGAGVVPQMNFRGLAGRVVGVDPDERVHSNPHLDEARTGVGERIPYPDRAFDLVIADNVLEHLEQPKRVFGEVRRVLKPGGVFLAKTPNRLHYVPIVATLTPTSFSRWFNALRGRNEEDTFRTFYRANTRSTVRRLAQQAGFRSFRFEMIESRPEYLRFSPVTYPFGWAYERLVNAARPLTAFRVVLMAELRR